MPKVRRIVCSNCRGEIVNNLIEGRVFVKGKFVQFILMCPHCRSVVRSLKPKTKKEEDTDEKKGMPRKSGDIPT